MANSKAITGEDSKTYAVKGSELRAIADAMRTKTGNTDPIAFENFASEVEEVFDAGKRAEYDDFWDKYQEYGNRRNYQYGAFGGTGWTDESFKPKYPIKVKHAYTMFQGCLITEIKNIDCSTAENFNNTFAYSQRLLKVGEIYIPLSKTMDNTFSGCPKLHTIEKLTVGESCTFTNTFSNCPELQNIVFDGTIGNSIGFSKSTKLSKASITNIIEHLSDTSTGKTLTLSLQAVNDAFQDYVYGEEGEIIIRAGSGTEEWKQLIAPKIGTAENPKWTITLV